MEKTLESPLDCKEIQPVHPKGNQFWIFIERTGVEAETPMLWPPDAKNWLIWKDPDAGKDWRREEKGTTEDEMVGWYHRVNGYELGWTLGAGDGQGSLVCCSPWGHKELDMTERLNWTKLKSFPGCSVVKNPPVNSGNIKLHAFDLWVRKIRWRRKWQTTPEFLPGKSHGQRNLVG